MPTPQAQRARRNTFIASVVCSGFVALFIGRAIEVQATNDQITRSRVNCALQQADRRDSANSLASQADQVLGNPFHHKKDGALVPIPPANFDKPPYSSFKKFRKLIIAQAVASRRRSIEIRQRIENCNKVFPKRKAFWIF